MKYYILITFIYLTRILVCAEQSAASKSINSPSFTQRFQIIDTFHKERNDATAWEKIDSCLPKDADGQYDLVVESDMVSRLGRSLIDARDFERFKTIYPALLTRALKIAKRLEQQKTPIDPRVWLNLGVFYEFVAFDDTSATNCYEKAKALDTASVKSLPVMSLRKMADGKSN